MVTQTIAQNNVKNFNCAHNSCAAPITTIHVGPFSSTKAARTQERLDHNLSAMLTHAARAVQQVAASKLALDLVTA